MYAALYRLYSGKITQIACHRAHRKRRRGSAPMEKRERFKNGGKWAKMGGNGGKWGFIIRPQ